MKKYRILHRTCYSFSGLVQLGPHQMRLRPREGHDLRIESSRLAITPDATVRWHRDVEGNSVATAVFASATSQLVIESEVIIQHYNEAPLDFLIADEATDYPFCYADEDRVILSAYLGGGMCPPGGSVGKWISGIWGSGEPIQTYALMERISSRIHETFRYQAREEPGVQTPERTLALGSGSCRDFTALYIVAARHLGLAARFVSGYLYVLPTPIDFGSTHAWAEVYLPGAGWKGFDPTVGTVAGTNHIPVATARAPESVPPVAGSFVGPVGANLEVGVWVSELQ